MHKENGRYLCGNATCAEYATHYYRLASGKYLISNIVGRCDEHSNKQEVTYPWHVHSPEWVEISLADVIVIEVHDS
jgi:hypothetical protein